MKLKTEKLEKLITENMVSNYANVSGDFNPIHLDDEYAKNTEFKNNCVNKNKIIFEHFFTIFFFLAPPFCLFE